VGDRLGIDGFANKFRLWTHVQVYHPNIDLEGNVCLNILREDWKPVLSINSILYGLTYLFLVSFPFLSLTYFTNSLLRCIALQLVGVFH